MSVEALAIALHHSRAKGAAKLVLLGIANHDGDGGSWPTVATLAKYAAVSERQVQKILVELEALGEVRREHNAGGTHRTRDNHRPNLYHFLLVCPPSCAGDKNHSETSDGRGRGARPPVDNSRVGVSPRTPQSGSRGVAQDTSRGVAQDTPRGVLHDTRTIRGNRPMNLVGHQGGEVSPAAPVDNSPPRALPRPERCADHQHVHVPPPCGACKDARLTLLYRELPEITMCPEHAQPAGRCRYCPGGDLFWLEQIS
jgi:hypothetical protein